MNLPYAFSLRIQGIVAASPHLSGATLQRVLHANGPAMLFGAAREIIRAATGRGPWPAVIIPSTNFLFDIAHYRKIVIALSETIRLMAEIMRDNRSGGQFSGIFPLSKTPGTSLITVR